MELALIQMMLENPSRVRDVIEADILAFFTSDALKSLGENIVAGHRSGQPLRLADMIDRIDDRAIREKILELTVSTGPSESSVSERLFDDTVRRVKERWYKERQRDLRVRLLRAQETGDQELCNRLLDEKERLRHEQKECK